MRTVFSNDMVAHVWAQQSQPEGRSQNGNLYFAGPTLYSYGRHFALGRFVSTPDGGRAVILNSDSYSVTTSGHKHRAWSAVSGLGLPIFHVPAAGDNHAANLRHFEGAAILALQDADNRRKARSRDRNLEAAESALSEARRYAEVFGIEWRWEGRDATEERYAQEFREASERRRQEEEAAAARRVVREAEQRRVDAEDFAAWQAGTLYRCPWSYATDANGSVYMRVRGEELETSRGASVPLAHAVKVFRFIRQCRERGEGFKANGRVIRVGHFTVSEITPEGDMVAGCHRFTWERIAEVAEEAGVFTAAPSDEAVEVRA